MGVDFRLISKLFDCGSCSEANRWNSKGDPNHSPDGCVILADIKKQCKYYRKHDQVCERG